MGMKIGMGRAGLRGALRAALFGALLTGTIGSIATPSRADDQSAIQGVIADQLADFQANDLAGAFAHASPSIQGMFGTPDRFGEMVQRGYPMVWRPLRYEMRSLRPTPRGLVQTVFFEDRAGGLWEADYIMEEVDGIWRIDGVTLRSLPGLSS